MQTLDQNLQELVKRNLVSIPEARDQGRQQGHLHRRLAADQGAPPWNANNP